MAAASAQPNYYEVLGVRRDASSDDIRKAYLLHALVMHPDKDQTDGSTERFQLIVAAYNTLKNSSSRKAYDSLPRSSPDLADRSTTGNVTAFSSVSDKAYALLTCYKGFLEAKIPKHTTPSVELPAQLNKIVNEVVAAYGALIAVCHVFFQDSLSQTATTIEEFNQKLISDTASFNATLERFRSTEDAIVQANAQRVAEATAREREATEARRAAAAKEAALEKERELNEYNQMSAQDWLRSTKEWMLPQMEKNAAALGKRDEVIRLQEEHARLFKRYVTDKNSMTNADLMEFNACKTKMDKLYFALQVEVQATPPVAIPARDVALVDAPAAAGLHQPATTPPPEFSPAAENYVKSCLNQWVITDITDMTIIYLAADKGLSAAVDSETLKNSVLTLALQYHVDSKSLSPDIRSRMVLELMSNPLPITGTAIALAENAAVDALKDAKSLQTRSGAGGGSGDSIPVAVTTTTPTLDATMQDKIDTLKDYSIYLKLGDRKIIENLLASLQNIKNNSYPDADKKIPFNETLLKCEECFKRSPYTHVRSLLEGNDQRYFNLSCTDPAPPFLPEGYTRAHIQISERSSMHGRVYYSGGSSSSEKKTGWAEYADDPAAKFRVARTPLGAGAADAEPTHHH